MLAVGVAMYFVANWFARPIKVLRRAMADVARGHYELRITEQRRDEYGALYTAFNDMAQALHERVATSAAQVTNSAESPVELSSTLTPVTPAETPDAGPTHPAALASDETQPPQPAQAEDFAKTQVLTRGPHPWASADAAALPAQPAPARSAPARFAPAGWVPAGHAPAGGRAARRAGGLRQWGQAPRPPSRR